MSHTNSDAFQPANSLNDINVGFRNSSLLFLLFLLWKTRVFDRLGGLCVEFQCFVIFKVKMVLRGFVLP